MLEPFRANPNVFAERRVEVLGHLGKAVRPVDRERPCAPHHPRREDEVRQAEHVIAMEVGDEGRGDAVDRQAGRGESPLDTDAGIDEEYPASHHHRGRRSPHVRQRPGCAGTEHHDHGLLPAPAGAR